MDRSARIYRIHQLLRERRRPVPFNDFLRALEVSPATLKRDFQFLRDQLEAPLEYDGGANGYHYRDDGTFVFGRHYTVIDHIEHLPRPCQGCSCS
ncbi:MAG: HTH domain-containing protein [Thiohalospira sp.]